MAKSFDQFQAQLATALQDAAGKLAVKDRDALLLQAMLQRYSSDSPLEKITDVPGTGTSLVGLPAGFEDGFSNVGTIEFPIGNVPPTRLDDADWQLYRTPTGLQLLLMAAKPVATENLRVGWTARHAADGSTIPEADFEAVCDYAASLGFEALAGVYAQTGEPTIAADVVSYRTKGQEYMALAKAARKRYFNHMGIDEASPAGTGPAFSLGELDQKLGAGVERLTHPKPR